MRFQPMGCDQRSLRDQEKNPQRENHPVKMHNEGVRRTIERPPMRDLGYSSKVIGLCEAEQNGKQNKRSHSREKHPLQAQVRNSRLLARERLVGLSSRRHHELHPSARTARDNLVTQTIEQIYARCA